MPPPEKKYKLDVDTNKLKEFREEIKKIGTLNEKEAEASQHEEDPLIEEDSEHLKRYIREQIRLSERRIQHRLDGIEHKLNRLLERRVESENVPIEALMSCEADGGGGGDEQIIEEFVEEEDGEIHDEFSTQIFPIADEGTFDWFMNRLKDESYRDILVSRRWQLTRNCGTRSFNVSVKDFLRMHFELAVCIIYSTSGYGSRGVKKKKLDSQSLTRYVFDCFNKSQPAIHSEKEVSRAIINFWGRTPDTFAKSGERAVKGDIKYE